MKSLPNYTVVYQDLAPQSMTSGVPYSGAGITLAGYQRAMVEFNIGTIAGTSVSYKIVHSGSGDSSWSNVSSCSGVITGADEVYLLDVDFFTGSLKDGAIKSVLTPTGGDAFAGVTVVFYDPQGKIPDDQQNTVAKNY